MRLGVHSELIDEGVWQFMGPMDRLKSKAPPALRRMSQRMKLRLQGTRDRKRTPREVFSEVYERRLWSGSVNTEGEDGFFSGPGSNAQAAVPYAEFVRGFISRQGIKSVIDLGCGDFRVGRLIAGACTKYVGIDIVEQLVAANTEAFGSDVVSFRAMNIIEDELPNGDLCLVREVLQHLSNAQINRILKKLAKYEFVLVTDIQPGQAGSFTPNKDKVHGPSTRIGWGSALRLDLPPFNQKNVELVLETTPPYHESYGIYGRDFRLRTYLLRHGRPSAER